MWRARSESEHRARVNQYENRTTQHHTAVTCQSRNEFVLMNSTFKTTNLLKALSRTIFYYYISMLCQSVVQPFLMTLFTASVF